MHAIALLSLLAAFASPTTADDPASAPFRPKELHQQLSGMVPDGWALVYDRQNVVLTSPAARPGS